MRKLGWMVLFAAYIILCSCDSTSDNGRSTTGPGISVHCAAQTPVGDTTTVVKCAPQEASK